MAAILSRPQCVYSLASGKFEWNFWYVIFNQILVIYGWGISCEIALIWMSLDFTDDQSTLVQVMAWCHQATSHYMSQYWPRSLLPYGVIKPQWVNGGVCWDYFWHDDVIKWKHFPRYWPFVRGIHRSPVNSPHKGQWRGALMFSLICVWINGWVNNREAGDLRHYCAHYDVTVMRNWLC